MITPWASLGMISTLAMFERGRVFCIVFQVDLSSILRVIYDYSVMSKVIRAYPLLVWGVTLGLLPSCKVGGTH